MMRAALLFAAVLCAPAAAQDSITFVVDQSQSNFNWSGSTSLGPLVGNPSTSFQIAGTQDVGMAAPGGGGAAWSSDFVAGDLLVVPDIQGAIPNPLPFLPPLATISGTNIRLSLVSGPFGVQAGGGFTTVVSANMLSGQFSIVPLVGTPSIVDLTGTTSTPTQQSGTFTGLGSGLLLAAPIDLTFDFDDPASGVSGSLTVVGTINANWSCPPATAYCTAKTTSGGCTPTIAATGTPSWSSNSGYTLSTSQVEPQNLGIYFFSRSGPAGTPFQGGFLCLAAPVTRLPPTSSGGAGACSGVYAVDFNAYLASSNSAEPPGAEFWVQCWFRDPPEPISGTGLSDALRFTLCF